MTVDYTLAINQNNPCEFTGDAYITLLNRYTSIEEMSKGERIGGNIPYKEFKAIAADEQNYFVNALQLESIELSTGGKTELTTLINSLIEVASTTDFNEIKGIIVQWEGDLLQKQSDFSKEDLVSLFSASSMMRYGALYWMERFKGEAPGSSTAKGSFWKWLACAVSAAVCILVVGPILAGVSIGLTLTLGGSIIWGAIGFSVAYGIAFGYD
ncbi:hypothetical protein [Flaviaesturariibacter amylovorans]|uniref:Uncharacterized protein n=1 Tax=Flaviaesturariibacter amylovorans TaxID=1084520 RepID=A0ABP8HHX1_9BACT